MRWSLRSTPAAVERYRHGVDPSRARVPWRLTAALLAVSALCATARAQSVAVEAEPWPEADRLFRQDPRWLGADAAYSIPLAGGAPGEERVLWLFGDSFVAPRERAAGPAPEHPRAGVRFVRNSVGVQSGLDPSRARMRFAWRETPQGPASFFPEEGERWLWPQHGIQIGRTLLVFLMRVRATPGEGLGFAADGWRVAVVDDPAGAPESWDVRLLAPAGAPAGLVVGAGVLAVGEHVVALAAREPGDHAGFLVRWERAALARAPLAAADLERCEWWAGARGWVVADALDVPPAVVLADAGAESSLTFDARLGRFVHVHSRGFGATTVALAFAERIEGPWSPASEVFRPPESDAPGPFVYAAKGHPELAGADLVVTYATNALEGVERLVTDDALYWPRFVRLRFAPR